MVQSYKIDLVKDLKERLDSAKAIVLVDYKGINIEEVNELRKRFRDNGVDYFVQKNTLVKIALNELGITALDADLKGSTGIAVCKEDEVSAAREMAKFVKEVMDGKAFPTFKAGYVDGEYFSKEDLSKLSLMPSKEELMAKILGSLNAPLTNFVGLLNALVRQFVLVVDAVAKSKAE